MHMAIVKELVNAVQVPVNDKEAVFKEGDKIGSVRYGAGYCTIS